MSVPSAPSSDRAHSVQLPAVLGHSPSSVQNPQRKRDQMRGRHARVIEPTDHTVTLSTAVSYRRRHRSRTLELRSVESTVSLDGQDANEWLASLHGRATRDQPLTSTRHSLSHHSVKPTKHHSLRRRGCSERDVTHSRTRNPARAHTRSPLQYGCCCCCSAAVLCNIRHVTTFFSASGRSYRSRSGNSLAASNFHSLGKMSCNTVH